MNMVITQEAASHRVFDDGLDLGVPTVDTASPRQSTFGRSRQLDRARWPLTLLASGTVVMLAAAAFGAVALRRPHVAKARAAVMAEAPLPVTSTVRAEDVVVVNLAYEPGHSSGWHVHSGLHAVYVLSGTLTVYDEACRARLYGTGESYVGGQSPHMVRNETDADVEMIVTGIEVTGPAGAGSHLPAPAGCPVS